MVYEFGARLLQLRKEKNLTQQVLVDRAKALDPDLRLSDSVLSAAPLWFGSSNCRLPERKEPVCRNTYSRCLMAVLGYNGK